jgi:hypothetical protein
VQRRASEGREINLEMGVRKPFQTTATLELSLITVAIAKTFKMGLMCAPMFRSIQLNS